MRSDVLSACLGCASLSCGAQTVSVVAATCSHLGHDGSVLCLTPTGRRSRGRRASPCQITTVLILVSSTKSRFVCVKSFLLSLHGTAPNPKAHTEKCKKYLTPEEYEAKRAALIARM